MARIKTSKGFLEYKSHLLYFGNKTIVKEAMMDNNEEKSRNCGKTL